MKIVMVDDSAGDRRLCKVLLSESHGAELEFFEESSAAAGLATCRAIRPDCVLLDYKLPDLTGLEFLARLQPEGLTDAPTAVVMLTGMASEQVAVEAMKSGAQDYLVKDRITAEGLHLAVAKAMQKVGLIRALQAERDRLAESLAEKEVLIKEVHHRVKNNLQVIASLLRLQAGSAADPIVVEALRGSQNRVESMAHIHEQLYQSGDLRQVDLAKQVTLLVSSLLESFGVDPSRIAARVAISPLPGGGPVVLGVNEAIPTGLILNELITNSLKHAFPQGRHGSVEVSGGARDGCIVLEVRDDGAGVPDNFDLRKSKSLGLEIVHILVRQLKGTVSMQAAAAAAGSSTTPAAKGTAFRISFPERQV